MEQKTAELLNKVQPEEKVFPLMGRDITSPAIICEWIKANIDIQPADKLREALEMAIAMSDQYASINELKRRKEVEDRVIKFDLDV